MSEARWSRFGGAWRSGSVALVALLAALATRSASARSAGASGWPVAWSSCVAVARGAVGALGPADLVTLARAMLACALAALVADSFLHSRGRRRARRAGGRRPGARTPSTAGWRGAPRTVSTFGARFDGEVDAFLMLVLSVYVAATVHGWVLAIGLARYAFGAAGWVLPWMRAQLPPRYWRKVVTAVQGIVLTVAAAEVAPPWLTTSRWWSRWRCWPSRSVGTCCGCGIAGPRRAHGSPARPGASSVPRP